MSKPIRRSELTCPGHSLKMMTRAAAVGADEVIFDLEDACAVSQKEGARATVIEAFRTATFADNTIRAYRINGVETPWCYRDVIDIIEAVGSRVEVVVIPKVRSAADVQFVDRLLTQIERARGLPVGAIALEALLETAQSILSAEAIAKASPRLKSLIFGVADYAGEIGARNFREQQAEVFAYPRAHLLAAARAAGLDAIDSVTVQFKDLEQVKRDAEHAARLGFDGKWAIHPAQLEVIHQVFTPTVDELARAQKIVDAYATADTRDGLGAIVVDGEMIDAATLTTERRKLEIARRVAKPTA